MRPTTLAKAFHALEKKPILGVLQFFHSSEIINILCGTVLIELEFLNGSMLLAMLNYITGPLQKGLENRSFHFFFLSAFNLKPCL